MRFKYLEELTDDELLYELKEVEEELQRIEEALDNPSISSEERSETLNSDLPYARDKKAAIEAVINSRGIDIPTFEKTEGPRSR